MAENDPPIATEQHDFRIRCRSKKLVRHIESNVVAKICQLVDSNVFWTDEEKEKCKTRFKEIFERTLQDNVLVQNQPWCEAEADQTSEMEAVNVELKSHINLELLPELDEKIVMTAMRRKDCPLKCANYAARRFKCEKEYYSNVTVSIPEETAVLDKVTAGTEVESTNDMFGSLTDLKSMIEGFPGLVDNMMEVKEATKQVASDQRTPSVVTCAEVCARRKLSFLPSSRSDSAGQEQTDDSILLPIKRAKHNPQIVLD